MSSTVLTLTMNSSVDVSFSVDQVRPEKKLRCSQPLFKAGGGGINVSRAIKKLGGKTFAVCASAEPKGKPLYKLLSDENIECRAFRVEGRTRENFTASEKSSQQQYRFVMPGVKMSEKEWLSALEAVAESCLESDYIVATGSLPPGVPDDFYAELASRMQTAGLRTIIDTSGEPLRLAAQKGVFMIKCNLREFKQLTGEEIQDEEQILSAGDKLIHSGDTQNLVITLGAGGCFLINRDKKSHFRSPTVPIKSRVGAGDSMTAGIVYKMSGGSDLVDAVRYGIAAGAAAVMTPGSELCCMEDTERLYSITKNNGC